MNAPKMAALILLVASALLIFPITKPSSSVFYLSCAFLLLSIAIAKWEKKRRFKEALDYLGILPHGGKSLHYLQWGAFALILACAVTFGLSFLLLQFGLLDTQAVQDKVMSLPALSLLVAIALSPIGEETFFRGFLFRKLSEWLSSAIKGGKTHDFPGMRPSNPSIFPSHPSKPSKTLPSKQALRISFKLPFQSAPFNFPFSPLSLPPLPVVCSALLSSLLFALMHLGYGSFAEIAVTFAVGLVFCAATYQSKSTIPAILAHCAYNLISLSAYFCAGGACGF